MVAVEYIGVLHRNNVFYSILSHVVHRMVKTRPEKPDTCTSCGAATDAVVSNQDGPLCMACFRDEVRQ